MALFCIHYRGPQGHFGEKRIWTSDPLWTPKNEEDQLEHWDPLSCSEKREGKLCSFEPIVARGSKGEGEFSDMKMTPPPPRFLNVTNVTFGENDEEMFH